MCIQNLHCTTFLVVKTSFYRSTKTISDTIMFACNMARLNETTKSANYNEIHVEGLTTPGSSTNRFRLVKMRILHFI